MTVYRCRSSWIGLFCALGAAAQAQPAADPMTVLLAQASSAAVRPLAPIADEDTLAFAAGELGQERVVKGAPYCADAVHETIQWLPDASGGSPNRIVRQQTSRLCRDGEGRTRQEVERNGRALVYLRDPAARESWVLEPQRKTARRLSGAGLAGSTDWVDQAAWRDYAERMRSWAAEVARSARQQVPPAPPVAPVPAVPPVPPAPPAAADAPAPVVIQRAGEGSRSGLRVHVLRPGAEAGAGHPPAPPVLAWPAPPPAVSWRAQALAPRGPAVVTALPAREIEGLRVHGQRSSWAIEAGRIGNERAIQIVREVWTSPELMLTVASRDFDPRSGEVNYRLQNIRRGEPEAALMRVPADHRQARSASRTDTERD